MSKVAPTSSALHDDAFLSACSGAASPRFAEADAPRFKGLDPNICVIAVTGGPCAGKSSGMAMLQRRLTERGFKVFVVPEVATILINGGLIFNDVISKQLFQRQVLLEQLNIEDRFLEAAAKYGGAGHRVVILCDRGAMDGRAYQSEQEWLQLLSGLGLNEQMICEHRYTGVLHLRTCADGAPASFTLDNNPARAASGMTPEKALELDRKTAEAWQRHPSQRFIENAGVTWPQKLQNLLDKVLLLVEPGTVSAFAVHKFVIGGIDEDILRSHVQSLMVVRILENLLLPDVEHRERRIRLIKDSFGQVTRMFIAKTRDSSSTGVKTGNILTSHEYSILMQQRCTSRHSELKKSRFSFFHEKNLVKIDVFSAPSCLRGLTLMSMEQESCDKSAAMSIPPFIKIQSVIQDIPMFLHLKLTDLHTLSEPSPPAYQQSQSDASPSPKYRKTE